MDTTVHCPDCGGVIGKLQEGQRPCTCDDPGRTPRPEKAEAGAQGKTCCKCGKDLSAKKRFRDEKGYWCEACHFAANQGNQAGHRPCDACGRFVKEEKLLEYEGLKICSKCLKDRKRENRVVFGPVVFSTNDRRRERRKIILIALVAAVLLAIILLASFHVI